MLISFYFDDFQLDFDFDSASLARREMRMTDFGRLYAHFRDRDLDQLSQSLIDVSGILLRLAELFGDFKEGVKNEL